jgi:hypothetical protein
LHTLLTTITRHYLTPLTANSNHAGKALVAQGFVALGFWQGLYHTQLLSHATFVCPSVHEPPHTQTTQHYYVPINVHDDNDYSTLAKHQQDNEQIKLKHTKITTYYDAVHRYLGTV